MRGDLKPIETEYHGCRFRSRLEARWAVFFDACGARWEYEPQGYVLDGGTMYLPDFLIHDIPDLGDVYFEVKGDFTPEDEEKIVKLHNAGAKVIVVGRIPVGRTPNELGCRINGMFQEETHSGDSRGRLVRITGFYSWRWINGEMRTAFPVLSRDMRLMIARETSDDNVDGVLTLLAYRRARQARFEHGEAPEADPVWMPT